MKKKLYTPEEIEIGKYYMFGTDVVVKLLKRTDKKTESYPNKLSNVYIFDTISLKGERFYKEKKEIAFNPEYKCLSDFNIKPIQTIIKEKEKDINFLKKNFT